MDDFGHVCCELVTLYKHIRYAFCFAGDLAERSSVLAGIGWHPKITEISQKYKKCSCRFWHCKLFLDIEKCPNRQEMSPGGKIGNE